MTYNPNAQHSLMNLPDDTTSNIFEFLTTADMTTLQGSNKNTYKKLRLLILLRRTLCITSQEYVCFNAIKEDFREKRILTSIRDKLVEYADISPNFAEIMNTDSLMDFNHSINWLDRYELDDQFIDLLSTIDYEGNPLWTPEEQLYVVNWQLEFRGWFEDV